MCVCVYIYVLLQRLEARIALLQSAVDEYYKAKNEFSAKVKTSDSSVTGRLAAWGRVHCLCNQNITSVFYQEGL